VLTGGYLHTANEAQRKYLEFIFRWNFDSSVMHQCVSDELKGFYDMWIIEETNQVLTELGLDLVHQDHLSVFTFADTMERFGLAKLVSDGEGSDSQIMSLDSASIMSSSPSFPVQTKDEKALVIELLSRFTKASGMWDVKGLTSHWNMMCELMRIGTLPQRQINPKHHSQIAKYLKSLSDTYTSSSTGAESRDMVECLREQLQRTASVEPMIIPAKSKDTVCRAFAAGMISSNHCDRYAKARS
jgi:hypothetical protein